MLRVEAIAPAHHRCHQLLQFLPSSSVTVFFRELNPIC
jgi:hypothetical protein